MLEEDSNEEETTGKENAKSTGSKSLLDLFMNVNILKVNVQEKSYLWKSTFCSQMRRLEF